MTGLSEARPEGRVKHGGFDRSDEARGVSVRPAPKGG